MKTRIESVGTSLVGRGKSAGSVEHAVRAATACLEGSSYRKFEVQYLVNTGVYRDEHIVEPAMASFIQNELKMNPDFHGRPTLSFDLTNGGCGMLNALHLIDSMMKSGAIRVGLVVSSEAPFNSKLHPNFEYRPSGAAMMLDVSPDNETGFDSFVFRNFDEHAGAYEAFINLKVKRGEIVITRRKDLENIYRTCATAVFEELLAGEKIAKDAIDYVIPSQVSENFVDGLGGALGVEKSRIVNILHVTGGDPLTTSPVIGYNYLARKNLLGKGKKVLFLTVGAGVSAAAALYTC